MYNIAESPERDEVYALMFDSGLNLGYNVTIHFFGVHSVMYKVVVKLSATVLIILVSQNH